MNDFNQKFEVMKVYTLQLSRDCKIGVETCNVVEEEKLSFGKGTDALKVGESDAKAIFYESTVNIIRMLNSVK